MTTIQFWISSKTRLGLKIADYWGKIDYFSGIQILKLNFQQ